MVSSVRVDGEGEMKGRCTRDLSGGLEDEERAAPAGQEGGVKGWVGLEVLRGVGGLRPAEGSEEGERPARRCLCGGYDLRTVYY